MRSPAWRNNRKHVWYDERPTAGTSRCSLRTAREIGVVRYLSDAQDERVPLPPSLKLRFGTLLWKQTTTHENDGHPFCAWLSISAGTGTLPVRRCRIVGIRPAFLRKSIIVCTQHGDMHPKYSKARNHPCDKPQNQPAIHGIAGTCRIG